MRISDWSSDVCSSDLRDYRKVGMTDGGVALSVQDEDGDETLDAERLLLSIGRKPNTRGLGLQQAGVALAPNGGIRVDERMRTTSPGLYAAGDVTGRGQFVYMAAYEAKIAAPNRSEEHT